MSSRKLNSSPHPRDFWGVANLRTGLQIAIGALLICSVILNGLLVLQFEPLLPYYQTYRNIRAWTSVNLLGRGRPDEKLIYQGSEFTIHPAPRPTARYQLGSVLDTESPTVLARQLRSDVLETLGHNRITRGPLSFDTHGSDLNDGYYLHSVSYQTQAGIRIPAYLLEPSQVPSPWAAVLVIHGCGYGKAGPAGVIDDAHNSIAVRLAQVGFLVLVPDRRGFGELQPVKHYVWPSCSGDRYDARSLLEIDARESFSTDLRSLDVFDLLVAADYLASRDDVTSLGLAGLSGGGVVAIYVAGQNEDIDAVALANALPFRHSISESREDEEPGATHEKYRALPETPLDWLRMRASGDLAPPLSILADDPALVLLALLPPRPLLLEFGELDTVSYVHGKNAAIGIVQQVYKRWQAPEQVSIVVEQGEHEFIVEPIIDFFQEHLY